MRRLTRQELTAALAARQMLIERRRLAPTQAIRRLTPLQGQHAPAPYLALAARLEGFGRGDLEAALAARSVVKTTIMRLTLHVAAAADYPAFAQLTREARMRAWRKTYPHLDEAAVIAELGSWLAQPRTNAEIRERVWRYDGVTQDPWTPINFARTLLPLVQLPPAGFWDDKRRASFVVDPRPLPDPADAATVVLGRYLAAFGPASLRDAAAWAGVAQRDFAAAWSRLPTVSYRDEHGTELLDLPGLPLPPASTRLPVPAARPLGPAAAGARGPRADHPGGGAAAEAHAVRRPDGDRRRPGRRELGGRARERRRPAHRHAARRHPPPARAEIREEAVRTARFCEPGARRYEVAGV
jgi:DNA glycosylase AlkZ-like